MPDTMTFVHKPGERGEPGEPQPCVDTKYAARFGFQPCADQAAAAAHHADKQRAAGVVPAEPPPSTGQPLSNTAGVSQTTNNAQPVVGTFPCPFDPLHGPFASERARRGHVSAKHSGQVLPPENA